MQNIFPILCHDRTLLIKIGDFGAAKIASDRDPLITAIGTWEIMAPEILDGNPYTPSVDIWSLGYLFCTLLTGKPFFPDRKTYNTYVFHPDGCEIHAPRKALLAQGIKNEAAIDIVTKMLQVNPKDRPSAKDALDHEWFNNPPGVEPEKVTTDLYDHFMSVLSGPVLRRLIEVQPVIFESSPRSETSSFIYHGNLCACLFLLQPTFLTRYPDLSSSRTWTHGCAFFENVSVAKGYEWGSGLTDFGNWSMG